MIRPYLFIGVGGSGGKTLRALKAELKNFLRDNDWNLEKDGFPVTWQFLHFDTPYIQDGEDFPARKLSSSEYVGLVQAGTSLDSLLTNLESRIASPESREEIMSPLPKKGEYPKSVDEGAGQYRAIGRTVAMARLDLIKEKVKAALDAMEGGNAKDHESKLARIMGDSVPNDFRPTIFIVSSLAGGSGSGQFMDVSEAVKAARPRAEWINDQIAILYAPDVFDDPKISIKGGMAPNSLASIGELIGGKWRQSVPGTIADLYQSFNYADFGNSDTYVVGPNNAFLIGKSAGKIVFDSQNDVYLATAASLSKWVVDTEIAENFGHILKQNFQDVADRIGVKVDLHLAPPLNTMGFARVSLGMEMFGQYVIGRLARASVDSIVNGHLQFKENTEADTTTVDRMVKMLASSYVEKLQIGPQAIAAAIQPESVVASWRQDYNSELRKRLGKQNLSAPEWISSITATMRQVLPDYKRKWVDRRQTAKWVIDIQSRVNSVTASFAASHGLKVAIGLLEGVIKAVNTQAGAGATSPDEGANFAQIQQKLNELIGKRTAGTIPSEDPDLDKSFQMAIRGNEAFMSAENMVFVAQLMKDMADNYLKPLRDELASKYEVISNAIQDDDYAGTGENRYKSWPKAGVTPPPPPQNVRLLIKHSDYEGLFDRLLQNSTEASSPDAAVKAAVQEILVGPSGIRELKELDARATENHNRIWAIYGDNATSWVPAVGTSGSQSKWRGEFAARGAQGGDLDPWEDFAEKYMRIAGRALGAELRLSLYNWLQNEDPATQRSREETFIEAFESAITMCRPFAKINRALLVQAHGMDNPNIEIIPSSIPVDLESNSPLSARLKEIVSKNNLGNDNFWKAFKGEKAKNKNIDFFSTLKEPVHHFVFDNLTNPVVERWNAAKATSGGRQEFLLRRRSRLVPEAIPLAPEILEQLLRGWYVGRLLGRLRQDDGDPGQGPRLFVHQELATKAGWEPLPYPLYHDEPIIPAIEIPAIVAHSIGICLMECANQGSMEPFSPYKSLMQLGGPVMRRNIVEQVPLSTPEALARWIATGQPDALAPTPLAARAGTSSMSVEERKNAAKLFFRNDLEEFMKNHVNLAVGMPHVTIGWQMRREVTSALNNLLKMLDNMSVSSSAV